MVSKIFCDICDELVPTNNYEKERTLKTKKYGPKTEIVFRVNLSLSNHPTGWGGPPDICEECFKKIIKEEFK